MNELKGVSAVRAHKGIDRKGIESNSRQTLRMNSCDLGTKSSLGLNCYFTAVYIVTETDSSGYSASATDAASYHTYIYPYSEYSDTALPIVLLALRQRYETRQETSQRVPGMATRIRTIPYPYSRQSRRHKALRNVPRVRA